MDSRNVRCIVSGRVQGVWFRGSTLDRARQLGLTGWARNLEDGTVEVLACGPMRGIEELIAWLHEGPQLARVDNVEVQEVELEDHEIPDTFTAR